MERKDILNWPNRLSMLRIVLIAPFVWCLINLQDPEWGLWARRGALIVFALMSLTDGIDGFLARRFNQQTELGRFMDPVADKLLVTCAMILLGIDYTAVPHFKIPNWVVICAIGKDLFVVLGFVILFLVTRHIFIRPGWAGKICTLSQMILVVVTLLGPDLLHLTPMGPTSVAALLWFLWVASAILAMLTCWQYFRRGVVFAHSSEEEQTRLASY